MSQVKISATMRPIPRVEVTMPRGEPKPVAGLRATSPSAHVACAHYIAAAGLQNRTMCSIPADIRPIKRRGAVSRRPVPCCVLGGQ